MFFILVFHEAFAYGSLPISSYAKTKVGETVTFEILFWSDVPEKINFYADSNENFLINILPNPLYLSPFKRDGEILVGGKPYNVTKVRVFVTPKSVGNFSFILHARKDIPTKDITFVDERVFKFSIEVLGNQEKETNPQESQHTIITKESQSETNKQQESTQMLFFIFLIVLIIFISILIFKYS
jgi:hypothetical protein